MDSQGGHVPLPLMEKAGRLSFALFAVFILVSTSLLFASKAGSDKFRILILGDSLTEGYGVEKDEAFPALLEAQLKSWNPRIEIINGGSSGSTSASGPRRLQWYARAKPDAVVVALGSNDGLRGVAVAETRKNLERIILQAKKSGMVVYLTGLKVPPNYGKDYSRSFAEMFPELAKTHGIPLMEFLLEGVAGEPEMNLVDGIHPNEKGHALIAANLYQFLRDELKNRL